ncbi:hypothetical protein Tco_1170426 [Tanacetum coccineum]
MGSMFMANGEECLDGWVGAGGGEVKGGGDDFGLMEEPIDSRWVVIEHDKEGTIVKGWRSNMDGHSS